MNRYLWLTLLLCACGSETAGKSIGLSWAVKQDDAEANREFVTDTGWQVHLDDARIAVESVFALAPEADGVSAIAALGRLFVPVARAHGGHDDATGRRVRAEYIDPIEIDALSDETVRLGELDAEEGEVDLMKLEVARSDAKLPAALHGHQAYLRGSAERDGVVVAFEGGLDVADSDAARRVETPVKLTLTDAGTLTIGVDVREWLREAAFERLLPEPVDTGATPPDGDATVDEAAALETPVEITATSQVGKAWLIGARTPAAFTLRFTSED